LAPIGRAKDVARGRVAERHARSLPFQGKRGASFTAGAPVLQTVRGTATIGMEEIRKKQMLRVVKRLPAFARWSP
jgi:hypothetical protein